MEGKWLHQVAGHVSFTIRDVFSQQDIDPIIPYLPDEQVASEALNKFRATDISVPREVGASVIEKLQAIQRESGEMYRQHSERLDRAHSLVAHDHETKEMTLQEIALVVFQKQNVDELTDVMLWAVHKALTRNPKFRHRRNILQWSTPQWNVNSLS